MIILEHFEQILPTSFVGFNSICGNMINRFRLSIFATRPSTVLFYLCSFMFTKIGILSTESIYIVCSREYLRKKVDKGEIS